MAVNKYNGAFNDEDTRQTFRRPPEGIVTAQEGDDVTLPCEIDNQENFVIWHKSAAVVFYNGTREEGFDRAELTGNHSLGEHNLHLTNLKDKDAGQYSCIVYGRADDGHHLNATTQLNVVPRPIQTPSSMIKSIFSTSDNNNNYSDAHNNNSQDSAETAQSTNKGSQLQARDIPNSFTKLTSLATTSSASSSAGFISPYLPSQQLMSSPHARHNSLTHSNGNPIHASGAGNLLLIWPYLLMLFAGILFLANIYLIYSLIKRIRANNNIKSSNSNLNSNLQQQAHSLSQNNINSGNNKNNQHHEEQQQQQQQQEQQQQLQQLHDQHIHLQLQQDQQLQLQQQQQQQHLNLSLNGNHLHLLQQQQQIQPLHHHHLHLQHHLLHPHGLGHLHAQYPHVTTSDGSDSTNSASTAEFGLSNSSPSQTITSIII